jgi:Family of unknown function (DUF6152)
LKARLITYFAVLTALLFVPGPAFAHHGTSSYDMTQWTTLTGTLTFVEWANPHVLVHFDVKDAQGNTESWTADSPSPRHLVKEGWDKDTLKPGEPITVRGNRAKDGRDLLRLAWLVRAGGQQLQGYNHF